MGTNYYFRKKTVDAIRLHSIIDDLNADHKALVAKYSELLQSARLEMGIECISELDKWHGFYLPDSHADFGDIHLGKLSGGWKPSMQACEHFHSIQTLKQWYADNKDEYVFVNEYDEVVSFDDYLIKIHEWNQDPENEWHEYGPSADGFDWTYTEFA